MVKRLFMLLTVLGLCNFTAFAAKVEQLPDEANKITVQEQPDLKNNSTEQAPLDLPPAKTPAGWTASAREALTKARAENKYIMALFTGSDWCEYCTLMEKEIFATEAFKEWADKNVVKLYFDFPQYHSLPEKVSAQNIRFFQKYGVQGFPTAVFFTPKGQELSRIGYLPGGGENWVKQVEMLLPKKLEVENTLAAAVKESAEKKVPLLLGVYNSTAKTAAIEKEAIDQAFAAPELALPSGMEIVLAKVDYSKLSADDKKSFEPYGDKVGVAEFVLLDAQGKPVFELAENNVKPEELAKKVSSYINKPEYDGTWIQDYSEGLKLARLYNKPLLLFFTGSDWCVYCEQMQKNIFQTKEFAQKAKDYILVELDFPRYTEQPEDIQMQNAVMMNALNIQGFPTVVVEKSNGVPIGGISSNADTVEKFFNIVEKSLGNS